MPYFNLPISRVRSNYAGRVLLNPNTLPTAALVPVDVLLRPPARPIATRIIRNSNTLVVCDEGPLGEVCVSTSPVDCAFGSALFAAYPRTKLDLHRSLGESIVTRGIFGKECADGPAIDGPYYLGLCPFYSVSVCRSSWVADRVELSSVIGRGVAFGEVVCLDAGVVVADEFPVNLEFVSR